MSGYAVHVRNGRVVLPATSDDGDRAEVTSWNEAADNRQSFIARLSAQTHGSDAVRGTAVLVHHADNSYNSNAISVSSSSADDDLVAARHLGYLDDHFLRRVGVTNLPDLISFAGGEVECTVVSEGGDDLAVDLPEPAALGEAIRKFLAGHGVEAAGPPRFDDAPRRLRAYTVQHATTEKTLRLLATFADPTSRVDELRMRTVRAGMAGRALRLYEASGGRVIGTLDDQWLQLGDERDRERVLCLLGSKDVPVTQPVTRPKVAEDGTWPRNASPNVRYRLRAGGLDMGGGRCRYFWQHL